MTIVDLPAPVWPTRAIVWPGSAVNETLCSTSVPSAAYEKRTPSNSTLPAMAGSGTAVGESDMAGSVSSTSTTLSSAAMAPRSVW